MMLLHLTHDSAALNTVGFGETHGLGLQEGYPVQNRAAKADSQRQGKGDSGLALASLILTVPMFVEIAGGGQ